MTVIPSASVLGNASTTFVVATSFYTSALEQPFEAALAKHQRTNSVASVPYNQLNTFLLNPGSVIPEHATATVLLLLRVEDFIRLELIEHSKSANPDPSPYLSALRQREAEFLDILDRMRHLRLTVMICPAGRGAYDCQFLSNVIRITEHKISARLKSQQKHVVVNWPEFERFDPRGNCFNPAGDRLGHVPFSPEGLIALAEFFVQKIDQMPTLTMEADSTEANTVDFEHFLASLKVGLSVAPMTPAGEETSIGLMRHTTHFITHPADKSAQERPLGLAFSAPQGEAWVVEVTDRFGNYGVSGAVVFGLEANVMRIAFLFLTCPVLGRQVEHAMVHWLADIAEQREAQLVQVSIINGRDNKVLVQFLRQLGAEESRGDGSGAQVAGTATQFRLRVAGLKDSASRIAPNPVALAMIVKNTTHGEVTQC